nr:hypothetical protein [Tanacetum cinerariifolium]
MRRVGKGFSGVHTPLFEGMLVEQQVVAEGVAEVHGEEVNAGDAAEGDVSAAHVEVPTVVQPTPPQSPHVQPESPQPQPQPQQDAGIPMNLLQEVMDTYTALTRRVEHLELDKDDVSNQGRIIAEMDQDADVVLEEAKEVAKDAKVDESVVNVVTTAKIITKVVTAASETITASSITITATEAQVPAATLTAAPARVTDKVIDHVKIKAKEDPAVKKYQALKRKPQTEAQARKNMMLYLKNVVGFKMDYFKGMSYDDIRQECRALKRLNETTAEKAAKRKKLDEDVEELKRHLQIVPNKDDDVYTEATLISQKVPVVDYHIIELNNKHYYKIIRADDTHQLYVSFLSLLRNFDREDLEALCSLVKERFSTIKPKNFYDDFLLITLGAMFEKPDIHAQVWKNQITMTGNHNSSPYGIACLYSALLPEGKDNMNLESGWLIAASLYWRLSGQGGLGPCLPNNLSTYGARRFHLLLLETLDFL